MDSINGNLHEIIEILKYVFSHNTIITNKLDMLVESNILKNFKMLPRQDINILNTNIKRILIVIKCLNYEKLSRYMHNFNIDSYNIALKYISQTSNCIQKQFLLKFINDIQIVFTCFDLLFSNPKKYIEKLNNYEFKY